MPWEYSPEYYTEYTRSTWNEAAGPYVEFMEFLRPFGRDLLTSLRPSPGETILDMGTGPGEPALTIADQVGPTGRVIGIDLAEAMVERARAAALAQGAANASFEVMDCSKLTFPDQSIDAAVSRFGFQIFSSPEDAAAEAYRVLRPGGRIAVSVWGEGRNVPLLDAIVGPMLEHAEPDESGYLPTPYEMGGPGEMVRFLETAGFHAGVERRVTHESSFPDAETYLRCLLTGTPIGHSLAEETREVQQKVLAQTRANLGRWTYGGVIRLPAECVVVTAKR